MALSNDLISQFVKATRDNKKVSNETIVHGTIVYDGKPYVKIDGSDLLTPVSTTAGVEDGERVTVLIKNHSAIVTGNISSPSVRHDDVKDVIDEVAEFEILLSYKISTEELTAVSALIEELRAMSAEIVDLEAITALINDLEAKYADIEYLTAGDMEVINAYIETLRGMFAEFEGISTEDLEAVNAKIDNLVAYNANFTYVSAENLKAIKAEIDELDVKKLDATWANLDFANIDEAVISKLFTETGIIKDLVIENGAVVTGELVGVTIKGDLIEGGTIVADKLVVLGEDGLYYKLNVNAETVDSEQTEYNSLNGSIITAKSITAEKVNVSDLVAFGATIGGFHITSNSIYSGVKESAVNTTRGVYLDTDGQLSVGDSTNFLRYFKDENGNYKLEISAASLVFSTNGQSVEQAIAESMNMEIGARNLIRNSKSLIFDKYYFQYGDPMAVLSIGTLGSMILGQE